MLFYSYEFFELFIFSVTLEVIDVINLRFYNFFLKMFFKTISFTTYGTIFSEWD